MNKLFESVSELINKAIAWFLVFVAQVEWPVVIQAVVGISTAYYFYRCAKQKQAEEKLMKVQREQIEQKNNKL